MFFTKSEIPVCFGEISGLLCPIQSSNKHHPLLTVVMLKI